MDSRINTLIEHGDQLFSKRESLTMLWQEVAENFYPERADFTSRRSLGTDFAANLITSYPVLARRELGNTFGSMLRPNNIDWFFMQTNRENIDNDGKRWLEWATKVQRRAMFDRRALFVRATSEGDHDFAAFGQCVVSKEMNRDFDGLLFRCWHLRDVAWGESYDGKTIPIHRKWEPCAWELDKIFKGNVSENVNRLIDKTPYEKVKVRHVVIDAENYEAPAGKKWKTPYVSIFFELESGHVLEEIGVFDCIYVIPRWQTVSGSQYAYSPATVAALPDARLIQAMTLTLLEAGEKAVNPPLIATQEVIRSDMQTFAGGVTWVDAEYDERLGEALRPMTIDSRGIPLGMEMRSDTKEMIKEAFFLNKLNLPPAGGPDMTAYEIGQRVQEYIRNAIPLFGPAEAEYNGTLCEETFKLLMRAGAFGPPDSIPQSIRGAEVQFQFESPLHRAISRQKGQTFQETKGMLALVADIDQSATAMLDAKKALRDTLEGIGTPADWLRSEEEVQGMTEAAAQKQSAAETLALINQGGIAAEQVGKAGQAINQIQTGT